MSLSNAVKIASGLHVGMTGEDVGKYMQDHGMIQTNIYSISADRGRTLICPYPIASGVSLELEMECSQPPTSGLFGWKNPLLKRAYIQSQGTSIISIIFTNAL